MGVRRTIGCLTVLLLLVTAAGGSYVWYLWSRTDEMLHSRITTALRDTVPDWNVGFSRARFDFQGQIRVYDLMLQLTEGAGTILNLPETVVSVDREQLAAQRLIFQQVRLVQPQLDLVQDATGKWNWQGLGKLPDCPGNLPEWVIERGTIRIRMERTPPTGPATAVLRNVQLQLTPSGKRRYLVKGTVLLETAGLVNLDGYWHLDDQTWQLNGKVDQFKFRTEVWDQVCEFLPHLRTQLAEFPAKIGFPLPGPPVTDPKLDATGNLFFRLQKTAKSPVVDYKFLTNIESGQWVHPLSPYPLDDVRGKIYCDSKVVTVPFLTARHGSLQVEFQKGRLDRQDPDGPVSVSVSFKDLPLEPRTRMRLTPHLQEIFDQLQPTGKVNLDMFVTYSKSVGLRCNSDLTPLGCTIAHRKFPYQIKNLRGVVKKRGLRVTGDLTGQAAQRDVKITGEHIGGEENPRSLVDVQVKALPIDEVFASSSPVSVQNVLRSMKLQGLADLHYRMSRNGGDSIPWATQLRGVLHSGSMTCKSFPFAIKDFEGKLETDFHTWKFTELKGTHGATELTADGDYQMADGTGVLDLGVTAVGAQFDQELELALPDSWKKLWQEIAPQGSFDCGARIGWIPGQTPEVSLEVDLVQCAYQLKSLPFPIDDVRGHISVHRDEQDPSRMRADLIQLEGKHDDTKIRVQSGFAELESTGQWRVRMNDMQVEDLTPNNRFRRALPKGFREIIETLDPRDGSVTLNGMLDFRGTGNSKDGVTSAWDLEILCAGTTVTTGVDLKHLYGKFQIAGTWNGKIINTSGISDLTSMTILGYQFTNVKGPIHIAGDHLYIGSRDVVNPQRRQGETIKRPPPEQRITGRAIQGVFTLDGIAVLGQETSYRVVLTMRDALLERYAELYLPNQHDLRGIMTGEAELSGRGSSTRQLTGRGQLLIRPAALYQLPVMLAVLKQLNGGSPNNTAFDEAQAFFEITNNRFVFNQVDLKGAALNLKGFGFVHFDRRLTFDFFSSVPRARAPLAILQQVVGQATMGWMGVEVRGTLDSPIAHIRPAQRLDDAVKRFLSGIDPRPTGGNPSTAPPLGRQVPSAGMNNRQQ